MEQKNVIMWALGIALLVSFVSNLGDFSGNATRDPDPIITVVNPVVKAGFDLEVNARNAKTSQEYKIYEANGDYAGKRFFSRASRCTRQTSGVYTCNMDYLLPASMTPGNYYVQAKDKRTGSLIGNKAPFTIAG